MDLNRIQLSSRRSAREIDPVSIFSAQTLRGDIRSLLGPQQQALRLWHDEHRAKSDVLLSATTGGGKTLIGLLMAQSLVNETRGRVLYLCATTQLVEQVCGEAGKLGMPNAAYTPSGREKWLRKEEYDAGDCACVTTYHAAFNGRTIFRRDPLTAVVLDDAHVAPSIIRDCFTIKLKREHTAWRPLADLFRPFFEAHFPSKTTYRIFADEADYERGRLFVPFFFLNDHLPAVLAILESHDVSAGETGFAYEHLRDHLNRCVFMISQHEIEIAPAVLPTYTLPYFDPDVRRLYMTATLPSRYECIKTFGVDRAEPIVPEGIGTAQRLFAFPGQGGDDETKRDAAKRLIAKRKACIIVPADFVAERWTDVGESLGRQQSHDQLREFKESTDAPKLILSARYDGIDLPGESCNVLVLDGLPRGAFLLDRFFEENLAVRGLRQQSGALRVTQAVGRIFRSSTDHGAVVIVDEMFRSWLRSPTNRAHLPGVMQQQIQLGLDLIEHLGADDVATYDKLIDQVVDGDAEWDSFYKRAMKEMESLGAPEERKWGDKLARLEYDSARHLWDGRFDAAASGFVQIAEDHAENAPLSAWYLHMAGLAYLLGGKEDLANAQFVDAANMKSVLGRPDQRDAQPSTRLELAPAQAEGIERKRKGDWATEFDHVHALLAGEGGANASEHEEGLRKLGALLGFEASRPDHEEEKGPDVLWQLSDPHIAVGFALKTQKSADSVYKKSQDIAHVGDCAQWIKKRCNGASVEVAIVGPAIRVVPQASPPEELRVIQLEGFQDLAHRAHRAYKLMQSMDARQVLTSQGLSWPQCLSALPSVLATDLQESQ